MKYNFSQLNEMLKEVIYQPGFEFDGLTREDKDVLTDYANEYFSILIAKFMSTMGSKNSDNKFYGGLLSLCNKEVDWDLRAPAACYYKHTNFVIVINPIHLLKYNLDEIYAVLRHECYHILNNHLTRMKKIKNIPPDLFNIAADCCINQYIQGLPENCITLEYFKELAFKLGADPNAIETQETLEYYCHILEQGLEEKISGMSIDENGNIKDKDGNTIGQIVSIDDHSVFNKSDEDPAGAAEARIKKMIEQAKIMSHGVIPGDVQSILDRLNAKPEITWIDLMRRYRGQVLYGNKSTPVRLNRRQPGRRDLKGTLKDRLTQIVVVLDTSGSMGQEEISYCMEQVFGIFKQVPHEVTIIQIDTEIQDVYTARRASDVKFEAKGRGGTLFTPAIEYINSHPKYQRSIVVFFTDGGGETEIPKPRCQQLLWVITSEAADLARATSFGARSQIINTDNIDPRELLSVEHPYGEVKLLKGKEK